MIYDIQGRMVPANTAELEHVIAALGVVPEAAHVSIFKPKPEAPAVYRGWTAFIGGTDENGTNFIETAGFSTCDELYDMLTNLGFTQIEAGL